jgi:hypothetical protein
LIQACGHYSGARSIAGHCCNTRVRCRMVSLIREIVAGIEHAVDLGLLRPLFDFVKVLLVHEIRTVCFFVGQIVGHFMADSSRC